ncbi:zinc finger protein 511 [Myripristis murdjan]|nr:zinc finger protein 511 [Myripristis murdjan]
MLQPEASDYLIETLREKCPAVDSQLKEESEEDNTPSPFSFTPQRIHLHKDHELFEDGDIHRHLYLQNLSTSEPDDKPKLSVSEFACHISGCSQLFSSVEEYEHHYNSLHRHVCCSCRRSLPSARLLDIHIQEWHDTLFTVLAQRQDMYQCLVEGCGQKFRTSKQRKDHLIRIHKYPADFRFDKTKKGKGTRGMKSEQQSDTAMEVTEDVCEVMCDTESDQTEGGEAMEPHSCAGAAVHQAISAPAEMHSDLSAAGHGATNMSTEQGRPRYSYRVPKNVCFGQGSVRGFRARGRRK